MTAKEINALSKHISLQSFNLFVKEFSIEAQTFDLYTYYTLYICIWFLNRSEIEHHFKYTIQNKVNTQRSTIAFLYNIGCSHTSIIHLCSKLISHK